AWPAERVARFAMFLDLRDVPPDRLPALDLARVLLRQPAAHVVAAVPLEPPARVVAKNPALASPFRQRLACIHAEMIERAVASAFCQFRALEPAYGKFLAAVGHVFAAEDTERKHLRRRQFRFELRMKIPPGRRDERVAVTALHAVVDDHESMFRRCPHD